MLTKKRKLVFYSGGQQTSNHRIHSALVDMMSSQKRKKRMTYIPYCEEGSAPFFVRFQNRYRRFGVEEFRCLPVDRPVDERAKEELWKSDAIYLAGGNTFYFLKHLRRAGLLTGLRQYVKQGGILAGLSAGAIMMTPNIHMAAYPPFDCDDNEVGLKNLKALNLVDFEFFPHYQSSSSYKEAMLMYSLLSSKPIYACRDGSGVLVDGEELKFMGSVHLFHNGHHVKVI